MKLVLETSFITLIASCFVPTFSQPVSMTEAPITDASRTDTVYRESGPRGTALKLHQEELKAAHLEAKGHLQKSNEVASSQHKALSRRSSFDPETLTRLPSSPGPSRQSPSLDSSPRARVRDVDSSSHETSLSLEGSNHATPTAMDIPKKNNKGLSKPDEYGHDPANPETQSAPATSGFAGFPSRASSSGNENSGHQQPHLFKGMRTFQPPKQTTMIGKSHHLDIPPQSPPASQRSELHVGAFQEHSPLLAEVNGASRQPSFKKRPAQDPVEQSSRTAETFGGSRRESLFKPPAQQISPPNEPLLPKLRTRTDRKDQGTNRKEPKPGELRNQLQARPSLDGMRDSEKLPPTPNPSEHNSHQSIWPVGSPPTGAPNRIHGHQSNRLRNEQLFLQSSGGSGRPSDGQIMPHFTAHGRQPERGDARQDHEEVHHTVHEDESKDTHRTESKLGNANDFFNRRQSSQKHHMFNQVHADSPSNRYKEGQQAAHNHELPGPRFSEPYRFQAHESLRDESPERYRMHTHDSPRIQYPGPRQHEPRRERRRLWLQRQRHSRGSPVGRVPVMLHDEHGEPRYPTSLSHDELNQIIHHATNLPFSIPAHHGRTEAVFGSSSESSRQRSDNKNFKNALKASFYHPPKKYIGKELGKWDSLSKNAAKEAPTPWYAARKGAVVVGAVGTGIALATIAEGGVAAKGYILNGQAQRTNVPFNNMTAQSNYAKAIHDGDMTPDGKPISPPPPPPPPPPPRGASGSPGTSESPVSPPPGGVTVQSGSSKVAAAPPSPGLSPPPGHQPPAHAWPPDSHPPQAPKSPPRPISAPRPLPPPPSSGSSAPPAA